MTHDDRTPAMDDLERMLAGLPELVAFPETPDIASRVAAALPPAPPLRQPAPIQRRRVWFAVAAILLALLVLTIALPGPRHAVADFLGLPGIRIELGPASGPDEGPTSIGSSLLFGERSTLDDAQTAVDFPILTHGEPDEVYVRSADGIEAVSLLYMASDELPQIGETGVGMLLMEFRASGEAPFLAKRAMGDGTLTVVTFVDGRDAFWITNGELIVAGPDLDASGVAFSRRSGNVLIWSDGQVTYRMETALDRETAITIAESLTPWREEGTIQRPAL